MRLRKKSWDWNLRQCEEPVPVCYVFNDVFLSLYAFCFSGRVCQHGNQIGLGARLSTLLLLLLNSFFSSFLFFLYVELTSKFEFNFKFVYLK